MIVVRAAALAIAGLVLAAFSALATKFPVPRVGNLIRK
jgi:hypothetical protein